MIMKKIILFLFLFVSMPSCIRYKIRVIQYDNTGYSLYLPMKKYRVGKWQDGGVIYYSEEMARFKIEKWKSGESFLDPHKKNIYIKIIP